MKKGNNSIFYGHKNACDALISRGITMITFHGDSFMRQMYTALFITLTGNYKNGSTVHDPPAPEVIQFSNLSIYKHYLRYYAITFMQLLFMNYFKRAYRMHISSLLQKLKTTNYYT